MTFIDASISMGPHLLADHPALDLLNTEAQIAGNPYDFWRTNDDVLRWMQRSGFLEEISTLPDDMLDLIEEARELRAIARELVEQRKAGLCRSGSAERLNAFLREYQRYPVLSCSNADEVRLVWQPTSSSRAQLLGAVAEAVARLLAEADFKLVRQCEDQECMMWFYDRTKAHRRRWCSMALCGNRNKVAAYRKRNTATS